MLPKCKIWHLSLLDHQYKAPFLQGSGTIVPQHHLLHDQTAAPVQAAQTLSIPDGTRAPAFH